MRLKRAMIALIQAPKIAMSQKKVCGKLSITVTQKVESAMLVKGPARDVFPTASLVMGPVIITAPGEIILKNGDSIESRVISAPNMVSRNSAHSPKRCADSLWASSWRRKAKVKTMARLTDIFGIINAASPINCGIRDMLTPMTSSAPRARCFSSVGLNQ